MGIPTRPHHSRSHTTDARQRSQQKHLSVIMNEATMSMSGRIVVGGNGSCAEDSFKISASAPICNGSGSVSLSAKPNYRPSVSSKNGVSHNIDPRGDVPCIAKEIQRYGSVAVTFGPVHPDFYYHKQGVYKVPADAGRGLGQHATKLIGWGVT